MLLGERIRELRDQRTETLKDVSKSVGLSVSYLSDIERGRTNPSLQTLEKLALHFEVSVTDVLVGVEFAGDITNNSLPKGLAELFADENYRNEIDEDWKQLLSKIELRGKRPQTKREWIELYLSIRRILDSPNK